MLATTDQQPVAVKRKLPVTKRAQAVLDLIGMDQMLAWVMEGKKQSEIAKLTGVLREDVCGWFLNHEDVALYRSALEASAESLMDMSEDVLMRALDDPKLDNARSALYRDLSDVYRVRAAQRSKYHRERQPVDGDTPPQVFAPVFVINPVAADNGKPVTCEVIDVDVKGA